MPGIPLPQPISVAQFVPDPNAKTFTEIWNETMGNLGTETDGFDNLFGQMTGLTNSVASIADIDPADLGTLSAANDALNGLDAGALALSLQPARDATDAALGVYTALTQPSASPTNPVNPPGTTPPGQAGASPCAIPAGAIVVDVGQMTLGETPYQKIVSQDTTGRGYPAYNTAHVICNDGGIFSMVFAQKEIGLSGENGPSWYQTYTLVITPSVVGDFTGGVDVIDSQAHSHSYYFFKVKVVGGAKHKGAIPVVSQK